MKNAVIVGASGGIGSDVARKLFREGWQLFLVSRDGERLEALAQEVPGAHTLIGDFSSFEESSAIFERATSLFGGTFSVVNCAGSIILKPAHQTGEAEYHALIASNLTTAFNAVRLAGKNCLEGSSVVLVSSCAAQIGLANHEVVAAVKGAIEALVRSAAATYAAKGIRFNAVAPGLTRTPLTKRITSSPQAEAFALSLHPLGRLGEPRDITAAITFLLGDDAAWVTGQILGVDGGLSRIRSVK